MSNLSFKKELAIEEIRNISNTKRLELLKNDNPLDHVSWSAMTYLILGYKNETISLREKSHISLMAKQVGLPVEIFIDNMSKRIEDGTIMATGILVGVNIALEKIHMAKTVKKLMMHYLNTLRI